MNIGVLCSGGLGYELLKTVVKKYNIICVFTDKKSVAVSAFCEQQNIPVYVGNPRGGKGYLFIQNYKIDTLVSINYLFLIEKDIYAYASKFAFNVHGSLLPKYRGRTPHVWAIINNEKETGVTAHKIDDDCDTGDIIAQVKIPICNTDTGNDVLLKFKEAYEEIVFDVLDRIEKENIQLTPQNHSFATCFGKRTPGDGKIDWNWQKERIYNWVRAQAYPYPGAFTRYQDQKITIDEVQFSDIGFSYDMPNGLILNQNPLSIKTPNGVIIVSIYRENFNIEKGEILK